RLCFGDETYALIEVTFQTIHFSCLNQEPRDYFGLNRSYFWRASQDSNLEPSDLESDALPIRATDPRNRLRRRAPEAQFVRRARHHIALRFSLFAVPRTRCGTKKTSLKKFCLPCAPCARGTSDRIS